MISFVYISCRKDPKFEWFVDSLYNHIQTAKYDPRKIQIVFVDFELQYDPERFDLYYKKCIQGRFDVNYKHVAPMPSAWQGKHKISSVDCFSAALARNTGVCYCKHDYVVFVDDLSVLDNKPRTFTNIFKYAKQKLTICFSYKKVWNLKVESGKIISKEERPPHGIDSRWNLFKEGQPRLMGGGQFYGFAALPIDVLLQINGYDEICNDVSGEDYHFGIRLSKLNIPIYYSKDVTFYESVEESGQHNNVFHRRDALLSEDDYQKLMDKYNITKRYVDGARTDISHILLDMLTRDKTWTEGNDYNLKDLRNEYLIKGELNFKDPKYDKTKFKTLDGIFLHELS